MGTSQRKGWEDNRENVSAKNKNQFSHLEYTVVVDFWMKLIIIIISGPDKKQRCS